MRELPGGNQCIGRIAADTQQFCSLGNGEQARWLVHGRVLPSWNRLAERMDSRHSASLLVRAPYGLRYGVCFDWLGFPWDPGCEVSCSLGFSFSPVPYPLGFGRSATTYLLMWCEM